MARITIGGLRSLTGRPEDYRDAVGAVTRGVGQLIHEYAHAGGDLGSMTIIVKASPDGDIRGTEIRLEGEKA